MNTAPDAKKRILEKIQSDLRISRGCSDGSAGNAGHGVGMLLSGGGGTVGGTAGTLLLIPYLGNRGERNGGRDRLRALEEDGRDHSPQQETNQLLSKLAGYLEGVMSRA